VTRPNNKGIFGDFLCQQKVTGAQTMLFLKLKHLIAHQTIPQKLKSLPQETNKDRRATYLIQIGRQPPVPCSIIHEWLMAG
jgi:hypothetical protein